VAYRKLYAVALITFGVAACGSGDGQGTAARTDDGLPYASGDQAPYNEDQPPSNEDQPPGNPDRPPSDDGPGDGTTSPGGGIGPLVAACRAICLAATECPDGLSNEIPGLGQACEAGCTIPAGTVVPCPSELAAVWLCSGANGAICAVGQGDQAPPADACRAEAQALGQCLEAQEPDDDPQPAGNCTEAGDCQNCGSQCATCLCEAGTDSEDAIACLELDDCPGAMP
jgi:hypothetical protein